MSYASRKARNRTYLSTCSAIKRPYDIVHELDIELFGEVKENLREINTKKMWIYATTYLHGGKKEQTPLISGIVFAMKVKRRE